MPKISLVVAMTRKHVIANGDIIPWDVKEDRELFRKLVSSKTVIMGRKTFDLMGGMQIGKHNVVLSSAKFSANGVDFRGNMEDAITAAQRYGDEIFVIGGASVYAQAMPFVDTMHISYIKKDYPGDKFFPEFDPKDWDIVSIVEFPEFEYVVYSRKMH